MNWKQPKVYAVMHKDETVRAASRSGGIFTAISDWVLGNRGIVYGCVLTENFNAIHIRADCAEERNLMRGSKYIQSKLKDTFKNVKSDLLAGRNVLFSGTPCQVAGIKKYLGQDYDNFYCIDIVCHGVPSPKVWLEYLKWQEKRNKSKVYAVEFRNKKDFGWREHIETLKFDNCKSVNSSVFKNIFYGHMILRPCCYECPYKSIIHPGDITIADYWGVEKAAPEFDDNKGVSLVLVNNETGKYIFNSVKDRVKWKRTRIEDSMQPPLRAPFPKPVGRDQFWHDFSNKSFGYIVRKYGGGDVVTRLIDILRKIKRKWVGR